MKFTRSANVLHTMRANRQSALPVRVLDGGEGIFQLHHPVPRRFGNLDHSASFQKALPFEKERTTN